MKKKLEETCVNGKSEKYVFYEEDGSVKEPIETEFEYTIFDFSDTLVSGIFIYNSGDWSSEVVILDNVIVLYKRETIFDDGEKELIQKTRTNFS